MSDDESPPDPLAAFDQLLRAVADIARLMRAYYEALLEQDFTAVQALQLTIGYQSDLMRSARDT